MNHNKQNTFFISLRSKSIPLIKICFISGLLYFLLKKGFISVQATQEALRHWERIIPAIAALYLTTVLGVFRWQWLLQAQGIRLSWIKTLQLTLIGSFFNIALPGAVSGDFVKAFYVSKGTDINKTRAFGSILFDRVAGLSALVLVSACALLFNFKSYLHTPLLGGIRFLLVSAALCVLAFYSYLFLVREHHDPLLKLFRSLEKQISKLGVFTRTYEGIRHYHQHRITVLKVLLISGLIHLMVGWCCFNFAEALGETHLSLVSLYIVVPLGLLITAVPVAPAGIGTGNIAFLYFFHLIGSERGADIYSLLALTNILLGSIGGLVYFQFKNLSAPVKGSSI